MSEMNADLKAAQQRIQVLERNLRDAEEANRRLAKQVIKADQRVSDLNGEVLRLGLQLKHHLQLQAERDALASKLAELEGQEPIGEVVHSDVLPNAEGKYRHEFMSDFRIGVQAELYARPIPAEMSPEFTDTARSALLWVLWHHQGGSSPVGQPIRYALGMGEHERLSERQVQEAKRWAALTNSETRDFHRDHAERPVNARLLSAARAVVARWETPLWKDAPATAGFIYELRDALAACNESARKAVRLTQDELEVAAKEGGKTDWVTLFQRIETAVLRKNGIEVAE